MDSNERYEVKAEAFRMMTGQMAPGKDPPRASYSEPFEDRMVMWDKWVIQHDEVIRAMLLAFERIMEDE